jgi:acyl carrier protein
MQDPTSTAIDRAIDRLNELRPVNDPVSKERSTVLLGPEGVLDSMDFVNLLAALDEELAKIPGNAPGLTDRLTAEGGGLLSVGDLSRLIEGRMGDSTL